MFLEQLKEAKLKDKLLKEGSRQEQEAKASESAVKKSNNNQSSAASDRGSVSSDKTVHSGGTPSERKRSEDGSHYAVERAVVTQPVVLQSHPLPGGFRNNLLKAELSLDEDTTSAVSQTSSTSGMIF